MLTCKKCGSEMSGIDLVCKHCGTPWGKKGKSKAPLFLSLILVVIFSCTLLYYTNPELLGIANTPIKPNNNPTQDNIDAPKLDNENTNPSLEQPPIEEPPIEEPPTQEPPATEPPIEETPVILPPVFTTSKSSSATKPYGNFTYTADKTTDGDNSTAWLEGAKGNGINEWIEFSANTEQYVNGFILFNGYQKNEKTYINNGKIKKLLVTFSDNSTLEYELPKQTFNDSQKGHTIKFENPIKTKTIRFTILDVYKGAYYEDTGINEIKFY